MAQTLFRVGLHERPALFEYFYRHNPDYGQHQAGYAVFAGLDPLLEWMGQVRFGPAELDHLKAQRGRQGQPLFSPDFLRWLESSGSFEGLSLRAIGEGRVVHPLVPLVSVEGPLAQAQLLETALLNRLNFETLIATKASRVREAAGGGVVLEFGLRRAPGEGGNAATRAALIGGADLSSNVGMSAKLGLQAAGTHGHSLVQTFIALGMSELDAFRAFAEVYPDDTILLVDTLNVLESGVPHAIQVFEELRRKGHRPVGIRIDSGDLAYLAIQSARLLDRAGFPEVSIVLSSDLDELVIWQIRTQILQEAGRYGVDPEALLRRLVYGVGTRMVTSWGQPALGGVYKLVALWDQGWKPAMKLSESLDKVLNPGKKEIWRLYDERGLATADLLALEGEPLGETLLLHHPSDPLKRRSLRPGHRELLQEEVWRGKPLREPLSLAILRARRERDLERLDPGVRRLVNPHVYHVSLSQGLWQLKEALKHQLEG
jgi:nicotinate phosphoribosyltransferase